MPERLQLTRPVMRATARLHPNQARREIREEARHLRALKLLPEQHLAPLVHTVDLKHVLCQVDAYRFNLHVGRPPSVSGEYPSPLWHIDAARSRGVHSIDSAGERPLSDGLLSARSGLSLAILK